MKRPDMSGRGGADVTSLSDANGTNKISNLTGRYMVSIDPDRIPEAIALFKSAGHIVFAPDPSDVGISSEDEIGDATVKVRPTIATATVDATPDQVAQMEAWTKDPNNPIQRVKFEKIREAPSASVTTGNSSLVESYRNVVADLVKRNGGVALKAIPATANGFDESKMTWGLQATNVANSTLSGSGVKVAVLDTGIDFEKDGNGRVRYHPDFEGRTIQSISFVPDFPTAKDGNGHGTHCIGTACGPRNSALRPSYGIAHEAEILAVKVLNDKGRGVDGWIQDGIEWAITKGCRIISMSFGGLKNAGDPFNEIYEDIAQRALKKGVVLIAAAGNESRRPFLVSPINGPADCPSIIGVAAIDRSLDIASFSNVGLDAIGREINVAAPGVDVFSSFTNGEHAHESGTSMATPHVAGIAALLAEANPSATGPQLWNLIINSVKPLSLNKRDVGNGLVQAPLAASSATTAARPAGKGGVGIRQTSPITVGGGGSVGVSFDTKHYTAVPPAPGQPTKFVNQVNDQIEKLRIIDRFGGGPDVTPATVDCRIVVHCEDFDAQGNVIANSDSPIVIHGNPLAVELKVEDFTFGVPNGSKNVMYFNPRRKITRTVEVFEGTATQPAAQHEVPAGGVCTIDVLNLI